MMKDMDGLSRHIDPLIHRYLIQTYTMRAKNTTQRLFVYCHDNFTSVSNPRRVVDSDTIVVTKSSSNFPPLSIVHHSPVNFISTQIYNQFLLSNINHSFFITLFYLQIFFGCLLNL